MWAKICNFADMLSIGKSHIWQVATVMLLIGIALPYVGLGNTMMGRDEAYQALCVMNFPEAPLAMLTFYIGYLWTGLFGNEILSLRILMIICYQLSIAISCCYLFYRTRRIILSSFMFMIMSLGVRFSAMPLYGWDAGAYPWMTLFAVTLLIYAQRPSLIRMAVLGISTGIMVMSRIPSLAALPIILGVIIYTRREHSGNVLWREVCMDSFVGLIAFIFTTFLVIMLLSSGKIGNYFSAWTSDNIINGHFDKEMLIWRWKDVTRRVVTAFYPMIGCFAAARYMLRVKRFLRLNLILSAVACVVLSFYFLKTYQLYSEYAAGVFEGLFLIIILLPLLYNMTHSATIPIPSFQLIVIACCSLLAGVGSDGFLERPMTVSLIPILCIYVYEKYLPLMRYFLLFSGLSVIGMYVLLVVSESRHLDYDFSDYPHLYGIHQNIRGGKELERFIEVSPIVETLKSNGDLFSVIGTCRYEFDYIFNGDVSYNLHHFHYFDRSDEMELLDKIVSDTDIVLVVYDDASSRYPNTQLFLSQHGFMLDKSGEYYHLYKRVM